MPAVTFAQDLNRPQPFNLFVERYTTVPITVSVHQSGSPVDLSAATIEWVAGAYLTKSTTLASLTVAAPATAGVFSFTITAAESLTLPYGALSAGILHECKMLQGTTVTLLFSGTLRVDDTLIEELP